MEDDRQYQSRLKAEYMVRPEHCVDAKVKYLHTTLRQPI